LSAWELERELYNGELSDFRKALLPIVAAVGGIAAPALIHFSLNAGTPTQPGSGIPMATDIAFALGVLALLGSRVPASLKIFLTALAVMDDLGAIIVIALFYTASVSPTYLLAALTVFFGMVVLNRFRVMALTPYLLGGALMWYLMLRSGIHATIAGVLLAFAIPYSARAEDEHSPLASPRTPAPQTGGFPDPTDLRSGQYRHRDRLRMVAGSRQRQQRRDHRRSGAGQATRNHAAQFPGRWPSASAACRTT
jgi:Na+/H+ antiporter NhaA